MSENPSLSCSNARVMEVRKVASVIPWDQVCKMFDKVQTEVRERKKEMLLKFIRQYRDLLTKNKINSEDSFFPVLRILLPALDRERGAYGIKEHKLAELYIKILGLKKTSVDAQRLLNYKKPKSGITGSGDFADIAFYVLKSRCPEKGDLNLNDVDEFLTTMAECHASKNQEAVEKCVLQMLRKMTANEQKWLIRVLLKDMHLGIGQTIIFSAWHPDAKDYYDVNNSLSKVCSTLQDPSVRLHEIEISLFSPFRPMLAERAVLEKVETQMKNRVFFVETKYDGERSQIHKNGSQYKYFSRNCFDFSSNFGTSPSNGLFTPHIHPLFSSHVESVILDGEMVGWSQKHKCIITKGEHMDVKNLKEDGDWIVCFCAFDILYLNGRVLTNLPLTERLSELEKVLSPAEGRVIITSRSEVKSKEDVVRVLNEAIDDREEGVVLKDPSSVYQPASRRAGWIKVKPEYVDTCVPELDLLIIGGYYGTGRRRGILSHFLLAVAETTSETTSSRPKYLHSVSRVGSGYTVSELETLIAKLSKYISPKQPPNVLVGREKPDVWFIPEKSCVVQVKAAEIVKTDLYKTGATLRFPRVEKIRSDKSWFEILTTEELRDFAQEASGKLGRKHYLDNGKEESPKKKARQNQQPSLPEFFRPADITNIVKKADLFCDKEFCIVNGGEGLSKQQLETRVAEHGGTFSQHPGKNTYCIVSNVLSVRVQNLIKSELYNVVKPIWILECIEASKILIWSPLQIFHLLPKNVKKMNDEFDPYGDSYFTPTNPVKLKAIMDNMTNYPECEELSFDDESEVDLFTTEPGDLHYLFRRVKAFFTEDGIAETASSYITRLKLRMYGGRVTSLLTDSTTHIVTPTSQHKLRPSDYSGKHIVSEEWILQSIKSGKLLNERDF